MGGQALKTVSESIQTAAPYRYVRIYTGYGTSGAKLLEQYAALNSHAETVQSRRYDDESEMNVFEMNEEQWICYIAREASGRSADSPVG